MAEIWKTVRVFISSTFRDMHAERDILVRQIFPELRDRCRKKHIHLIDVDLRWGVTEQDAQEGKALDICLDEIDFCRPFFLGLLGQRYGFVPPSHRHSITAQEIYHGVLHGNVPRQVVDLMKIIEEKLEDRILSKEQKECLAKNYEWNADLGKYLLKEKVSPTELKTIASVFEKYSIYQKDRSFFFFRDEKLTKKLAGDNIRDFFEENKKDQGELIALKKEIVDLGLPVQEYDDLEQFRQRVLETLWDRIEKETEVITPRSKGWLEEEKELHDLFLADRTRRFVGRRELLDRMHRFCLGGLQSPGQPGKSDPRLLVITGEPGGGKSALMARFTEEFVHCHPGWLVISHFVGSSPKSTSLRQMMRRLCGHLNRILSANEETPEDFKELLKLFPELLTKAGAQQNILIVIDAVNQLEHADQAHAMNWLPRGFPENVWFVISTLAGEARDALLERSCKPCEETVEGLTPSEIRELVGAYLKEIRHEFPNRQVEGEFYRKVEKGNPLYILVALEELRIFGKFEALGRRIAELPDDVPALFEQVLERIESDFTSELVGDCMSYIACGKFGMTAEELQSLLKRHAPRTEKGVEQSKLPDMPWTRIYRSFSSYLFKRSEVIDFFHGQLKEAVGKRYLQEETSRIATHKAIADYFEKRWSEPYNRALDEMPFHLMEAGDWEGLKNILCDLSFIEAKVNAGLLHGVQNDLEAAKKNVPESEIKKMMDAFEQAFRFEYQHLKNYPQLVFQQMYNRLQWFEGRISDAAEKEMVRFVDSGRSFLHQYRKPNIEKSNLIRTLDGHKGPVKKCAYSKDRGKIISLSDDRLVIWNSQTGQEIAILKGDSCRLTAFDCSPDGKRIVTAVSKQLLLIDLSGDDAMDFERAVLRRKTYWKWNRFLSSDQDYKREQPKNNEGGFNIWFIEDIGEISLKIEFIKDGSGSVRLRESKGSIEITKGALEKWEHELILWDSETGEEINILKGYTGYVKTCRWSPDGKRIVASSGGETKAWDCETGQEITSGSMKSGLAVCSFSPDGKRIITADGGESFVIRDDETGREIMTLKDSSFRTKAWAWSPDGRRIASATKEGYEIWDSETGSKIFAAKGMGGEINACAWSPDGEQMILGSSTLLILDGKTYKQTAVFEGHGGAINDCVHSPDGRYILTASADGTLKVWSVEGSQNFHKLGRGASSIEYLAFTHDGRRVISHNRDGGIQLWDGETGRNISQLAGRIDLRKSYSPDGKRIISRIDHRTLKLWDGDGGGELATFSVNDEFIDFGWSPDGRHIASVNNDGAIRIYESGQGNKIVTLRSDCFGDGHLEHPDERIKRIEYSPDGKRIVSLNHNATMTIWNLENVKEAFTLKGNCDDFSDFSFSPDMKRILAAGFDGSLMVWDSETHREIITIKDERSTIYSCRWSKDGSRLVSKGIRGKNDFLTIWDGVTFQKISDWRLNNAFFVDSAKGARVVCIKIKEGIIEVFDGDSRKEMVKFEGHVGLVNGWLFSPWQNEIFSIADDRTLKIWDIETGDVHFVFAAEGPLKKIALSPDGKRAATMDALGNLYFLVKSP